MTTLFISDLHLDPKRPDITGAFKSLLQGEAKACEALYILGDFFEAWIGDDDDTQLSLEVIHALRELSNSGTRCFIMHGNRDFLIGEQFCKASGCELLPDPCTIDLYGKPVVLMHGDSLCTGDEGYMQLRQQLRSSEWQQQLLAQPLEARRQLAQQLRMASKEANSNKACDIMDVTPAEVVDALQRAGSKLMIHGHTHRPDIHQLDAIDATRIVLGDWDKDGWLLRYQSDGGYQLDNFPIA